MEAEIHRRSAGLRLLSLRLRTPQLIIVAAVWLIATSFSIWLVHEYGNDFPFMDDFVYLPAIQATPSCQFLWGQHNEHRILLPKLGYLGLLWCSGGNFKSVQYFNAICLCVLSLGLIVTAAAARGRVRITDAFFPAALLGSNHIVNLLWSFQIAFILPTALACALLMIIAHSRGPVKASMVLLAGITILMLPLCGASGLLLTPGFTLWLLLCAWRSWRDQEARRIWPCALAIVFSLANVGMILFYLWGYHQPSHDWLLYLEGHRQPASRWGVAAVGALARAAIEVAATGTGLVGQAAWPISGFVTVGVLLLGLAVSLGRAWTCSDRLRPQGVALFCLSFCCLALGIAWGRVDWPASACLEPRYATLMVPMFLGIYLALVLCEDKQPARLAQLVLLGLALAALPLNVREGIGYARSFASRFSDLRHDVANGTPSAVLAKEYLDKLILCWPDRLVDRRMMGRWRDRLEDRLLILKKYGLCGMHDLRVRFDGQGLKEIPFDQLEYAFDEVSSEKDQQGNPGRHAPMSFKLLEPHFVSAIHFKLKISERSDSNANALVQASWASGNQAIVKNGSTSSLVQNTALNPTVTVWIEDTIDEFRIDHDVGPCRFEISDMTLVLREK